MLLATIWTLTMLGVMNLDLESKPLHFCIMMGLSSLVVAVDLAWRRRRSQLPGLKRYFYPFEGGAVLFIPIWPVFVVLPLVGIVLVAIKH
jgi:hypothetical protein